MIHDRGILDMCLGFISVLLTSCSTYHYYVPVRLLLRLYDIIRPVKPSLFFVILLSWLCIYVYLLELMTCVS